MEKISKEMLEQLIMFSKKFFIALIILLVGFKVVKFIIKKISKSKLIKRLEKGMQTFILSIIKILLQVLICLTAIAELGIPMTSILALIGSFGLALGLALQGGLSNIAGGVMIMFFKPFKVGDFIDTHTDSGTVMEINIFHTILTTYDNRTVVLPNASLSNTVIVNYSKYPERILDLNICVDYQTDIKKVKKILLKIAEDCSYRIKEKDILIALKEHAESSLDLTFRIWVDSSNYWKAKFELLEIIKEEFDKNKISIPFKQLDIHLKNTK